MERVFIVWRGLLQALPAADEPMEPLESPDGAFSELPRIAREWLLNDGDVAASSATGAASSATGAEEDRCKF